MTEPRAPELASANALIQSFQQVLHARGDVALALLFGSRARGDASETSDIDVALLAPPTPLGAHTFWPISSWIGRGTSACVTHGSSEFRSAAYNGQPQLALVESSLSWLIACIEFDLSGRCR